MAELNEREKHAIDVEIAASLEALRRGESVVEALADVRAISHAALYAQVVAYRAWLGHAGVFASPAIEGALARAAAHIDAPVAEQPRETNSRRVLHIASAVAFPEGGHGRLIDRWIRSDTSSVHSLAITKPGHDAAPFLRDVVEESGGEVRLAPGTSSFVERASDLRQFASQFDAVVLHAHPHDPIPILALAWPGRPPTILCNHAPHVFWLGCSIADVVTYGREHSKTISVERRGIPPAACFDLPVPVDPPRDITPETRDAIRAELGVAPSDLFLLTVASEYKFRNAGNHDLVETVVRALADRPNVVWRIVGCPPQGRWAEVAERTNGRVRAVGTRSDEGLYQAADFFIDSYPFASRTAMLDAGAAGRPLLAPRWHSPDAAILGAWGSSIDDVIFPFHDERTLAGWLGVFISDPKKRDRYAQKTAEAISAFLTGPAWAAKLNGIYEFAAQRKQERDANGIAPHGTPLDRKPDDLDRYLRQLYVAPEPLRVLLNWHRAELNINAPLTFPGDEAWLAETSGLAAFIGEQSLIIRDYEALVAHLEQQLKSLRES